MVMDEKNNLNNEIDNIELIEEVKEKEVKEKRKKGKESIPSKTTLNLYYREDKTSKIIMASIYTLFGLFLLLVGIKFGIYDMHMRCKELETQIEERQLYSDNLEIALEDYQKVKAEYNRYTQSYLTEEELLQDRIELLNMLEKTVFEKSTFLTTSILEDTIFISYRDLNLDETSELVFLVEEYECVKNVDVQTASLTVNYVTGAQTLMTSMIIELNDITDKNEEESTNEE